MHLHRHHSEDDKAPMAAVTHSDSCNMTCASRGEEAQYHIYPKKGLSSEQQGAVEEMLKEESPEVSTKQHPLSGVMAWTVRLSKDNAQVLRTRPDFNKHVSSYNVACDCAPKAR